MDSYGTVGPSHGMPCYRIRGEIHGRSYIYFTYIVLPAGTPLDPGLNCKAAFVQHKLELE